MRRVYILLATAVTIYLYITLVIPTCVERVDCVGANQAIVNGTAESPFVYRILTPNILSALGGSITAAVFFHAVMFTLFYILLSAWLERWRVNMLALFLPALLFPVMFDAWWFAAYSITEPVLVLCGLLALPRYTRWYPALVVVGTLNREMTGVLLVLVFWALCGDWKHTVMLAVLAALTYGVVRLGVGERPVALTLAETFQLNVYSWRTVPALLKQLLLVPLWFVVIQRFERIPQPLRRLTIVSAIYFVTFLAGAMWQEIRLLLPVMVMILPVVAKEYHETQNTYWR